MEDVAQEPVPARLLLVDDEPNVLASLSRVLRHEGYVLHTAENGPSALAILEREPIDLLLCDFLMPDMDGAELCTRVRQQWPNCQRLLLTGQSDLAATVRAINDGHIYGYLAKPWDDDGLRLTLRQALQHQHAESERKRLEALTRTQNQELAALNATLEQRVEARTQELKQTSDMLEVAFQELRKSYVTATKVFSSLLSQRFPPRYQTNAKVGALVQAFATEHGLDEKLQHELELAAALYNLGKLAWSDRMIASPAEQLTGEQRELYRRYPTTGENLLMSLEHMEGTARLIRHHREHWNGNGFPDRLQGEAIPYGSRLLGLAVDFIELQRGMILPQQVTRPRALELLRKFSGRLYDPSLCRAFIALCQDKAPDLESHGRPVTALETRQLQPRMVLAQDIRSTSGMLLLHEGKELTAHLIEKLMLLEEAENQRYTILVYREDKDDE
ncbi:MULTISPECIES: HD domain-containing phosphohydrolase [Halomonadaceae]|jgi:response regulator RpfG family c-di-GMP phosphodiesterase|uniref:Response regulator n=1 Tax=Billgrantia aerodenitrificans TaxID=2733483 RepID=A0ABS9ANJ2_9GAMM|nr:MULTISPECIES: HD domain-containing phosphohydrolase [Halomonas]MCE8023297.1 response regulator [Halomonas aerodenitrificans]